MYYVYKLLDYKKYPFYIGISKNIDVRVREHSMNKNATPAKKYRVRKCIEVHGELLYTYTICETLKDARKIEAELIKKFQHQLINKTHGKIKNEKTQRRSKGRSHQCPHCLVYFKRINAHRCKVPVYKE